MTTKETSASKFFQLQRSVFAIVIDRPQSRRFHDVTPTPVWLTQYRLLICQKGPTCVYFCVIIVSYSIFMPLIQFMCLPLWSIARESQISQCHSNTSPIDLPKKDTLFVCCLPFHYLLRIFLCRLNKKYTLINAHFSWMCVFRLSKNDQIRIQILFGLKKSTEYEYYSTSDSLCFALKTFGWIFCCWKVSRNNSFDQTSAMFAIISVKMSMPLRKTVSLRNSSWSWSKIGVLFMGEKPIAGIPTWAVNMCNNEKKRESVEKKIFSEEFSPHASSESLSPQEISAASPDFPK